MLVLTPPLRLLLKEPLGILFKERNGEVLEKVSSIIKAENPVKLITVGDVTSERLYRAGLTPNIMIVDGKVLRRRIEPLRIETDRVYEVENPAGTISDEAIEAIEKAMEIQGTVKIMVDGEEDLLTLIAIDKSPLNSIVLYGQPGEGIVLVRVDEEKKNFVKEILGSMIKKDG